MLESLVYLFLLFAVPDFSVQWATPKQKEVTVKVNPEIQRDLIKIVSDGLRVKYRIQLKLCFKRSAWFDHCFDERKQVNEIKFDPVSENYLVTTDLFDDGADPKVESFTDFEQALIAFSSVDGIEIRSLNRDRPLRTKDLNS
ncbi:MAG: DUF4390 domain-containing protein, partial [Bdellovibrionales bacterium]|nr:DUF4390 domain-containing protein [Bdellovibrionales bacterium]